MPQQDNGRRGGIPPWADFVMGGLSGMAASAVTHPLDLVKVRMQLQGEGAAAAGGARPGLVKTCLEVARAEGPMALFAGLTGSLLRQATYTTTRIGVYETIKNVFVKEGEAIPLYKKILFSGTAGAAGILVGNPADTTMVRMQADGRLPKEQRRGYRNVFQGIGLIVRHEGVMTLWSGIGPNALRAILMSIGQLATYDQAKQALLASGYFRDGILTHLLASLTSGFVATTITSPLDVIKTRVMNAKTGEYRGPIDCAAKVLKNEGPLAFYKGWLPFFARLGPHTVVMFVVLEQMKKAASAFYSA